MMRALLPLAFWVALVGCVQQGRTLQGYMVDAAPPAIQQEAMLNPDLVLEPETDLVLPSETDMDAVRRTVYGEVRGQSDIEIVAVVDVIVNRYLSARWGTTLYDVVKACDPYREHCQFSVWNLNDPNAKLITDPTVVRGERFKQVAKIVDKIVFGRLYHQVRDITHGGDHYYHPKAMKGPCKHPRWARGHKFVVIGGARIFNLI